MCNIGTTGLPAAEHEDMAVLAAIELSLKRWRVAAMSAASNKLMRVDIAGGGAAELSQRLEHWRSEAARRLGRPVAVTVCYEAGRDGFWLARYLEARGITVLVIDPASLQVNRRARRVKTDRLDAEGMLRALRRHCWGEPRVFSVVRPPSPADEDSRCLTREREALLKERTRHVNAAKALLIAQGIRTVGSTRHGWLERMAELQTGDGRPLGENLRHRLARLARRLDEVARQIKEVEAELLALDRKRAADLPAGSATIAARLCRLVGIGMASAMVLEEEAFHRTFPNRRHVAAYAGLAPTPFQSGESAREQGISKAGNPRLRRLLIELSWLWLRYQPDSPLSKWFQARVGDARGRVRRVAITAVARKLLITLWHYVTLGVLPDGTRLSST